MVGTCNFGLPVAEHLEGGAHLLHVPPAEHQVVVRLDVDHQLQGARRYRFIEEKKEEEKNNVAEILLTFFLPTRLQKNGTMGSIQTIERVFLFQRIISTPTFSHFTFTLIITIFDRKIFSNIVHI